MAQHGCSGAGRVERPCSGEHSERGAAIGYAMQPDGAEKDARPDLECKQDIRSGGES